MTLVHATSDQRASAHAQNRAPGPAARPRRASRWRRRLVVVLVLLPILWLASSGVVAWKLTHRRGKPYAQPPPVIAGMTVEPQRLTSTDGVEIGAWLARGDADKPVVILLHGMGGSRKHALPVMQRLHADRYNVLAITFRGHGDSGGDEIDFGYSARADVVAAVDFSERQLPGRRIVVCGTSFGSAAALFAAEQLGTRVSGYVLESPYRDLDTATRNRLQMYLPPLLDGAAHVGLRLWARVLLDVDLAAISPYDAAARVPRSVPVTILTGARDRHATSFEAEQIFEQVRGHRTLIRFKRAGHANLFRKDPQRYYAALRDLLDARPAASP